MFGRQARIPVDLMYDTAQPENVNYGEYATKLQESLRRTSWLVNRWQKSKKGKQNCTRRKSYEVGVLVWLLNSGKIEKTPQVVDRTL